MTHFISQSTLRELQTGSHESLERRRTKRHQLRSRALVGIHGQKSIRGNMIDVSAGALSLSLPTSLDAGTECMVFFTITVDGQLVAVSGSGTVVNCVCSGLEGFRIGMRFHTQDIQAQRALQTVLGHAVANPEETAAAQ